LTSPQATTFINNWINVLTDKAGNTTVQATQASALLAANFTYQSDSSLAVVGEPVSLTYPLSALDKPDPIHVPTLTSHLQANVTISRAQYIAGLAETPGNLTIKTIRIHSDCHSITWLCEFNSL
jgi:hypothetical protein